MVPVDRKRGPADLRRKRLTQLLSHDSGKVSSPAGSLSPMLRGARSLPSLPSLNSTKSATFSDLHLDVALVPATASLLSPLKITRRASGHNGHQAFVSSPRCDRLSTEAQLTEQSSPHCANSCKILSVNPFKTPNTCPSTRAHFDRETFTPMKGARGTSEQQIADRTINDHQRDQYAQRREITRRRATVAAASQSFFDRLELLPIREAIQLFETQRQALLEFCLEQFRGHVDRDELKTIHEELLKSMAKTEKNLQSRLKKLQQEELQTVQKKISLQQLKKSHQEQIQQHLATTKEDRKQELAAARENIVKEQERLDMSYKAREVERKHHIEAHNEKLAEQIKNNAAARSTFKLAVQGSSPLYRTPWWSDESGERLKGFQRPVTVQAPKQSPVIHSKQRCQWYD